MPPIDAATRWSLGLWFVLGFVPVIGESIGWTTMLNHQGLASWVQALGSIGAVYTAFAVANAQNLRAEKERWASLASPVEVRAQLIRAIGHEALQLVGPQPAADQVDWLHWAALWEASNARSIAKVNELAGAFESISLADAGTSVELLALIHARDAIKDLVQAIEDAKVAEAAKQRIQTKADELIDFASDLFAFAHGVRNNGPRHRQV